MRRPDPNLAGPRIIAPDRRNHPVALAIFLAAYLGILAVVFAPQGAVVTPPSAPIDAR